MALADRIEDRLEALNISQSELARRAKLPQSTVNGMIRKGRRSSPHIGVIARALETTAEYLAGNTSDPSPGAATNPQVVSDEDDDMVEIDSVDIAYGMGGSFIDDDSVSVEKMRLPRALLRMVTRAAPDNLFVARGIGDSMSPTIQDSDVIFVDRSQRVPQMSDEIWAAMFGEVGIVKRLRPRPDGSVIILSDNANVPDDRATDGDLHIVGRVVAIVKRV